jgi:hypothetical protein
MACGARGLGDEYTKRCTLPVFHHTSSVASFAGFCLAVFGTRAMAFFAEFIAEET